MEPQVVRSRGRPRKRRREDTQREITDKANVEGDVKGVGENANSQEGAQIMSNNRKKGRPPKKRHIEIRGQALVGRHVMKEFEGSGVFIGKIVSYDTGLYRVEYEDGDCEDLDSGELREYLIGNECEVLVGNLLERRKKLDEHVAKNMGVKLEGDLVMGNAAKSADELEKADMAESTPKPDERDAGNVRHDAMKVDVPTSSELSGGEVNSSEVDDDDDADSSSDSCEYGQGWENRSEIEFPSVPPPELPPSSGNIGVPEEYVSHLFSVYGCLRSFGIRLFLSPFTLDDLVGCLNCGVPCTLLDSIHVALLKALRQLLGTLASDGSELASKCLRCIDWGLLDMLTWPVYLVHYLMTMGHLHGNELHEFYTNVLKKDYCTLSVGIKLTVLQILCDDALDNAELRAEIEMREESEVGLDSDGFTSLESEPRKVYPRYCKNSLGKDRENIKMDRQTVLPFSPDYVTVKSNDHNRDTVNIDEDGNGDECRLCGMDGMLLCCDGCPSAYHSRCIGVSKLSIPEGEWFCPECTISRIGPAITTGTSLRGAEIFGIDSYAQLFLGTCDHLLVLKVSVKASPFVRYYNCKDIVKVVTMLCSTPYHAALYMGICEAILKYWGLPQNVIPPFINCQTSMTLENRSKTVVLPTQVHFFGENGSHEVLHKVELENYASGLGGSLVDNVSGSSMEKLNLKCSSSDVSLSVPMETDLASMVGISAASTALNPSNMISKLVEQAEPSCSGKGLADRLSITGNISCISGNNSSNTAGNNNGVLLPKNFYMHGKSDTDSVGGRTDKKRNNTCLYMGSLFKPHAYINQFVHGDYAASAAANFAVLLSDENQASDVHASDPRKVMSANVTLQTKAFTSAAVRFFWPSTEKKLIEVPRERCSWCLHCKASVTSKKACLLNQAALNATRAEMKFFSSSRLTKNVEGGLYSISIYILFMEESLRGLILGPFRSEAYRQEWRKKVEEASTCSDLKSCLIELEGNLSTIAFSSEWTKLVDNWMEESSVPQSACPTTSTQKRGPGRRRKHVAAAGAATDDSKDKLSDISWWRGGKLAKLVFQRATLPSSVLKKPARQGGSRRIPGIYYADGYDVPKRSRQFIWRAAVEMARNASQLALQVRYLDQHIKWSDLVRPEQTAQDGKGSESEASAFRNALICEKKVVENKIIYGVAFGNQKHLSSRLMKSIIEKEGQDGKDKYWFSETRVPLYLIREYEEKAEKTLLLPSKEPLKEPPKVSLPLSKLQQKQVKALRRNVFRYLACKRDNSSMCLCASCHQDVLIDFAATCSACEGYCHKECTSSTVLTDEDVEFVTICKQCSHSRVVTQNNGSVDSPTSPLALQGIDYHNSAIVTRIAGSKSISQHQNSATASKSTRLKSRSQQLTSRGASETPSDKKPSPSDSSMTKNKKRPCHWGLIWKKKNTDDGSNFRLKNILNGNLHDSSTLSPECHMCKKPYNPVLMYISCETCHHWYHADAVELDESKLPNLIGFKCCRCRRIKSPICPYADPDVKKTAVKKLRVRGPKEEAVPATSVSEAISEQAESVPSTPISAMEDDVFIQVDDPLLLCVSEVEQIPEPKAEVDFDWNAPSGPAPQKLPVRRQWKNEKDDDDFAGNRSLVQCPANVETNNSANPLHVEWDVSGGGLEDGTTFDYDNFNFENTDFEPQTYFSFTELLEADEGNKFQGVGAPGTFYNWPCENSSSGFLEQCEVNPTVDNIPIEPKEPAGYLPCNICSQTEPAPDLSCQNCGLKFHSHCSPWEEFSQGESWSCGNCRVWR